MSFLADNWGWFLLVAAIILAWIDCQLEHQRKHEEKMATIELETYREKNKLADQELKKSS